MLYYLQIMHATFLKHGASQTKTFVNLEWYHKYTITSWISHMNKTKEHIVVHTNYLACYSTKALVVQL